MIGGGSRLSFLGERPVAAEDISLADNFVLTDYLARDHMPEVGFHEDRFPRADGSLMLMAGSRRWVVEGVRGGLRRKSNL